MAVDDRSGRIFRSVIRALDAGRTAEAVHQFMQVLAHDAALKCVDLPPLLANLIGRERADALVQAFAEHPCMVCKRGLLLCEDCKGEGYFSDGRSCDQCLGLGATNCDFCAGSGWITYSFVPTGLLAAVVLTRSKLALAEAQELLDAPLPNPRKTSASVSRKLLAKRLLRLNRLMGAFNNAVAVAQNPPGAGPAVESVLEKVNAACSRAASKLQPRIRELVVLLSETAKVESVRATEPDQRRIAERRVEFYASLAKSTDFTGTSLYHPHLQQLRPRPPESSNAPEQSATEEPD